MRRMLRLIPIIALAVALLLPATALAKPGKGPKPAPPPPPAEETVTVNGTVTTLKTNLADDVDGFSLDAGTTTWDVRFPPDQWQFIQSEAGVAVGESAAVTGIKRTDREGRTHISARQVCGDEGCYTIGSLKAAPPPPPPPGEEPVPPPPPDACEPSLLIDDGTVTSLKYAPKGELDGFFLADGTEVRFPPHEGLNMRSWLEVGDVVDVEGCLHTGPKGDFHIAATSVADDDGNSEEIERP